MDHSTDQLLIISLHVLTCSMHTHKILTLTRDYPVHAYAARVKAIGSIHLSVCLSVKKLPDLEI